MLSALFSRRGAGRLCRVRAVSPAGRCPPSASIRIRRRRRDAIARAHHEATAHATDALRAGTLGRVLQAWEQWDAAHQSYTRGAGARAGRIRVALPRCRRPPAAGASEGCRRATAGPRSPITTPGYLPARVKLAESLLDAGDLEGKPRAFLGADGPGLRAPPWRSGWDASPRRRAGTRPPSRISSARIRAIFRSSARHTTHLRASPIVRLDAATRRRPRS